jgi:hypothetical protein
MGRRKETQSSWWRDLDSIYGAESTIYGEERSVWAARSMTSELSPAGREFERSVRESIKVRIRGLGVLGFGGPGFRVLGLGV